MSTTNDLFIVHTVDDSEHEVASWVSDLSYFLGIIMERLLHRKISIISSSDLNTNKELKKKSLSKILAETQLFAVVLSPDFIQSDKAMHQLREIVDCIDNRKSADENLFKILKTEVSLEQQPEYLKDFLGYDFFDVLEDDNKIIEFNELFGSEAENQYWFQLVDLAYDIAEKLLATNVQKDTRKRVYLAETGIDQRKNRNVISRELRRNGHKVLPDKPLSKDLENLIDEIHHFLKRSDIAIHIVGKDFGKTPAGSNLSLVELQNSVASDYYLSEQERDNTDFSRIIWFPPDLKKLPLKQRMAIEMLKRDENLMRGAEMIQTPLETFKSIIRDKINPTQNTSAQAILDKLKNGIIYLIFNTKDCDEIIKVYEILEKDYKILSSVDIQKKKHISISKHRENLIYCDAVLIYYPDNNEFWLNTKINDLIKAPGYGRQKPILASGIITKVPLQNGITQRLANQQIVMITNQDETTCNPEKLKPFTTKLQAAIQSNINKNKQQS